MKKLLFVLALGAFASCGNGAGDNGTTDSTMMMDTTTIVPAPDTVMMPADTMHMMDTSMHRDTMNP